MLIESQRASGREGITCGSKVFLCKYYLIAKGCLKLFRTHFSFGETELNFLGKRVLFCPIYGKISTMCKSVPAHFWANLISYQRLVWSIKFYNLCQLLIWGPSTVCLAGIAGGGGSIADKSLVLRKFRVVGSVRTRLIDEIEININSEPASWHFVTRISNSGAAVAKKVADCGWVWPRIGCFVSPQLAPLDILFVAQNMACALVFEHIADIGWKWNRGYWQEELGWSLASIVVESNDEAIVEEFMWATLLQSDRNSICI